ncbi:MAG TPA: AmmeMemoRadiSam system protein A [Sulfurimonas sp.]|nr:AmmeMemoRadiSam system protein A [Sulfurimonas sp.]
MSQSLLLKIARESITEVFEAKNIINREQLLKDYPILNQPLAVFVSIYINDELRGRSGRVEAKTSLLEEIIYHAKTAAFENNPLKVSQYLHAKIELSLLTPLSQIVYCNIPDLLSKIKNSRDGLYICLDTKSATLLPSSWTDFPHTQDFVSHLLHKANLIESDLHGRAKIYTFEIESSHDEPILN